MPRPKRPRCVEVVPSVTYFKPRTAPLGFLEEMVLSVEELEAVRLKDVEDLDGAQAAARMQISRATFQRILESARHKVAETLVKGEALRIEGGTFRVVNRKGRCPRCHHEWEEPLGRCQHEELLCPECREEQISRVVD